MTTEEQNEAARQINQDVQKDNGMLPNDNDKVPPTVRAAGEYVIAGCPECGATMTLEPVECPDGKQGCCVCHYGYRCSGCGKQWHDTPNKWNGHNT
jgi:hypothetical protein